MGHLRRAWLAALVCLVAVLGVAPAAALAWERPEAPFSTEATDINGYTYTANRIEDGEIYVANVRMEATGETAYYLNDGEGSITTKGASAENYNVSWDPATSTLTLRDAYLTQTSFSDRSCTVSHDFSDDAVIFAFRDITINVMGGNVVKNLRTCPHADQRLGNSRYGICAIGCDVKMVGTDPDTSRLYVASSPDYYDVNDDGEKFVNDWLNSCGINMESGSLTASNLTLEVLGEASTYTSRGINVFRGNVSLSNSVVTATGEEAFVGSENVDPSLTTSYGICVDGYADGTGGILTLDNTSLEATAAESYYSAASYAIKTIVKGNSVLTAVSDTGEGEGAAASYGVVSGLEIDGGHVTATAGAAKAGSLPCSVSYSGFVYYWDAANAMHLIESGMKVVKGSVELTSGEVPTDGYSIAYDGRLTQYFSASDYHATVSYNAEATAEGAKAWTPECDGADQENDYVLLTGNKYFAVDSSFSPSVSVTWGDLDDLDGIRPDELELCFMPGDEAAGHVTVTPDADGVWAATLDAALPVYNAQLTRDYRAADAWEKIPYSVVVETPEGYGAHISGDVHSEGGLLVTLLHDVSHDVTFVSGVPGAKDEVQTVAHGELAVRPTDPTYEGWKFLGWYTDDTFSTPYDFETPVTADVTLYGGWVEASEEPGEPSEPGATDGTDEGGLPSTGDPTSLAAVLTAAAGALALAASRRR